MTDSWEKIDLEEENQPKERPKRTTVEKQSDSQGAAGKPIQAGVRERDKK